MGRSMMVLRFVGIMILVVIVNGYPAKEDSFAPPGSAGHHGAVQSGQFLLTNNDNYGLEIGHTPYTANNGQDEEEILPKPQKITQGGQQSFGGGDTYCAGCTQLTQRGQYRPQQQYQNNPQQYQSQQQSYSAPTMQQYQNPAYTYTVDYQGQGAGQSNNQNYGWNWNNNQNQQRQQTWQQQNKVQKQYNNDPATVQHLQINDDGGYSFAYNAADSSRQEQRNVDGSVSGFYSYQDPTGQQVQVDYTASPQEGFQAYGPTINPQVIPTPVQDTPEVQEARDQFFKAYDNQLKYITKIQAEAKARAEESDAKKQINEQETDASKVVEKTQEEGQSQSQDTTTQQTAEDDELENDAVVINRADEEPSSVPPAVYIPPKGQNQGGPESSYSLNVQFGKQQSGQDPFVRGQQQDNSYGRQQQSFWDNPFQSFGGGYQQQRPQSVAVSMPGSSYQYSNNMMQYQQQKPKLSPLGYRNQQQQQSYQVSIPGMSLSPPMDNNNIQVQGQEGSSQTGSPGYFYYVSVGGDNPQQYMSSSYPTSLKAHLAGGIPPAAHHDAQVPHQNMGVVQNDLGAKGTPPVYFETDPSYSSGQNILGFIPGALVSFKNGAYVSVNSAAVSSTGGNAQVRSKNDNNSGHQFPLLIIKSNK